jgi:hypothetical protein
MLGNADDERAIPDSFALCAISNPAGCLRGKLPYPNSRSRSKQATRFEETARKSWYKGFSQQSCHQGPFGLRSSPAFHIEPEAAIRIDVLPD